MRLVLFGPPGIGKGTQANLLTRRHGLAHTSTGSIIREAIQQGTPLGQEAAQYVHDGRLVPDHLVRELAERAISDHGFDNFILDGYPRTLVQAHWLAEYLDGHDAPLDAIVSIVVPTEVIVERLSRRRVNRETGETYHLDFNPPPPGVDPSLVVCRKDDEPEAIRKRLEVYYAQTAPVEAFYRESGHYHEVDGVGDIEEVYARLDTVLEEEVRRRKAY